MKDIRQGRRSKSAPTSIADICAIRHSSYAGDGWRGLESA